MSYNINEELTILEETKEQIKQAIINKGQSISSQDTFRSYADKILAIDSGGIDTSDATATVDDIADGVTAYVKGQKITGNVRTISPQGQLSHYASSVHDSSTLTFDARVGESTLYRSNALITISAGHGDVASALNLTSDQIARGSSILGVDGTFDGIDTSDADATSSDILENKSAYVNGQKVIGSFKFQEPKTMNLYPQQGGLSTDDSDTYILTLNTDFPSNYPTLLKDNVTIRMVRNQSDVASDIGLTADKIKKNVTILGITGTVESGIDTSDATATANDIVGGKTAYVNGVKLEGLVQELPSGVTFETTTVINQTSPQKLVIRKDATDRDYLIRGGAYVGTEAPYSYVADAIGLTASKIKRDETILGITGVFDGIDTSDATATINDILLNKTAYVNGSKLTGTFVPVMTQEEYDSALAKAQTILGGV